MIRVSNTKASERDGIMAHNRSAHMFCDGQLPRVVFTQAPGAALLPKRDTFCMYTMDTLPGIAPQVGFNRLHIGSALEHFGHGHWADPELGAVVALEPGKSRAPDTLCDLIEQID